MKTFYVLLAILFNSTVLQIQNANGQSIPTETEVKNLLNNNHFLVTYREREVLFGTYILLKFIIVPRDTMDFTGKA